MNETRQTQNISRNSKHFKYSIVMKTLLHFQDILGTLESGRQKLDDTLARGDAVLPETSNQGQELIREELNMLTNDFEQFDTDINDLQSNLGKLYTMLPQNIYRPEDSLSNLCNKAEHFKYYMEK